MSKRESLVRVKDSDIWLGKRLALSNASAVYAEFSSSAHLPDVLTRLSFVARADFDPSYVAEYLSKEMIQKLKNLYYFHEGNADLAERRTEKTVVATAMINPQVFPYGEVMGDLQEPFEDRILLPKLFESYRKKIAARKKAWN